MFTRCGNAMWTRDLDPSSRVVARRRRTRFRKLVCPAPAESQENPAEIALHKKQLIPAAARNWQPSESIRRGDILKCAARFPDRCKRKYPDVPDAPVTELRPRTLACEAEAGKPPCLRRLPAVPI